MFLPKEVLGIMPLTAISITRSGWVASMRRKGIKRSPPMYPEWRKYSFWSTFFPVSLICDALMTMTWSPVSEVGRVHQLVLTVQDARNLGRKTTERSIGSVHNPPETLDFFGFGRVGLHMAASGRVVSEMSRQ